MTTSAEQPSDPLAWIADDYCRRARQGDPPGIDEYVQRFPSLKKEIHDLYPALEHLERWGEDDSVSGAAALGSARTETIGDYTLVREIGRGGMGVVYEAKHRSLNRRVALKVLAWSARASDARLARFQRESRAAARLQHRAIVPVHEVGEDGGVHYYVMPYVRGRSLDYVLASLERGAPPADGEAARIAQALTKPLSGSDVHGSGSQTGRAQSEVFFRNCARLAQRAAEALAYAHAEGVLHRDVKPSNLLLDENADVYLTDFGLAKLEQDERITASEDVLGTPRYLAPEALRGWSDPRTDVYGLGATLYELVAGRAPFDGSDRHELLEKVAREEPQRPRKLRPRIPVDLETIVVRAMQKDPEHRYAGARDLAEDLERFADGQPIRARPPTWAYRTQLFLRRHRGIVITAGASALLLVLSLLAWSLSLRGALERRNEALGRAERYLVASLGAIEDLYTRVATLRLSSEPRTHALRRDLVDRAAELQQQLLDADPQEPRLRASLGRSQALLGKLHATVEDRAAARASFDAALGILEPMRAGAAGDDHTLTALALTQSLRGESLSFFGDVAAARAALEDGIELWGQVMELRPDTWEPPVHAAGGYYTLGSLLFHGGDYEAGVRALRAGHETLAAVEAPASEAERLLGQRVKALLFESRCLAGLGDYEGQRRTLRLALEEGAVLETSESGGSEDRRFYSLVASDLGYSLSFVGAIDESRRLYERALAIQEQLTERYPSYGVYRSCLAGTHQRLGGLARIVGDAPAAESRFTRAADQLRTLHEEYPENESYTLDLAACMHDLAFLVHGQGRSSDAPPLYREAIDLLEELPGSGTQELRRRVDLALLYNNYGSCLLWLADPRAEETFLRARALYTDIFASGAGAPDDVQRSWLCGVNLVRLLARGREFSRVEEIGREAVELVRARGMWESALGDEIFAEITLWWIQSLLELERSVDALVAWEGSASALESSDARTPAAWVNRSSWAILGAEALALGGRTDEARELRERFFEWDSEGPPAGLDEMLVEIYLLRVVRACRLLYDGGDLQRAAQQLLACEPLPLSRNLCFEAGCLLALCADTEAEAAPSWRERALSWIETGLAHGYAEPQRLEELLRECEWIAPDLSRLSAVASTGPKQGE